ncbi:MAG: HlyD family efflux transporter periplasmic adaptor subunit [Patescibacteria group bacterium]|nr:HlyD family efflux transporter periplasmic adaptor subunit [Patescibacteria group bacterium]
MSKFKLFIKSHRVASIIVLIVALAGCYYWYRSAQSASAPARYVVAAAKPGTVIASVQGSGQVDSVTSINVNPQVTETVTGVYVQPGDYVRAGQLLVQLDPTNEQKALRQAELSLQSAQISLSKLQEAPATTTLVQDQNAVTQAEDQLNTASATLQRDYQSGFDTLTATFTDLQNIITGVQNFVQGADVNKIQADPDAYVNLMPNYLTAQALPYRNNIYSAFQTATAAYQNNLVDFHAADRNSSPAIIDALLAETASTAKNISNSVKSVKDLLNFVVNNYPSSSSTNPLPQVTNTYQTNFGNYTNTINTDISNLLGAQNTISSDKTAIKNAQLSLNEAQNTLTALLAGPDTLDVQSQNISIQQQQLSLQTAQQNLDNTSIRAPISGVISAVSAVAGESVASPAVTMVGSDKVAEVTLNEVDAAKVSLGQQAALSFDALPNLSLAGKVVEVDPVGTVSQGVVNYNVKISFASAASATSTDQVKPGMSVTANIITQADQNVVTVPNSALLTVGSQKFIMVPASPLSAEELASSSAVGIELAAAPVRVPVATGISNSNVTEITSGLNVGDQYIARTISGSAGTGGAGTNALRTLGGGAGGAFFGGGAVRVGGGGRVGG